ncbi:MAG: hypothetical protein HYR76_04680 [Ignavibacteria bacterium]|nr:hypothetical protein [Ignavibacteria bacterium]
MSFGQSEIVELQSCAGLDGAIRRFHERPASLHLMHGHSSVYTFGLAIGSATRQPLAVIDGAMKFNSYTLSRIARFLALPPKALLARTHVTRSFTAFQTEAAITIKLPRFIANTSCRSVIILGMLDTYYDEQVKPLECQRSLHRIIQMLRALVDKNINVLVADIEVARTPP